MKINFSLSHIVDSIFILLGSVFIAIGLVSFLVPNNMVTGGTAGLSLLLHHSMSFFTIGVWMIIINVPLLLLGIKYFGKLYAIKSIITIIIISAFIDIAKEFLHLSALSSNDILSAIFGGIFIGMGLGLIIKAKSSAGGTTIIAAIVSSKSHYKASEVLFIFDVIIILLSFFVFSDVDKVLFSVISIYSTTKIIDVILSGRSTKKTVHLVSSKIEEISKEIIENFGPYGTILQGYELDKKKNKEMILVVIDASKIQVLREIAQKYDKDSFLVIADASELHGRGY